VRSAGAVPAPHEAPSPFASSSGQAKCVAIGGLTWADIKSNVLKKNREPTMGLEWGPRDRSSVMGGSRVGERRCSTAEPSIIDRKHRCRVARHRKPLSSQPASRRVWADLDRAARPLPPEAGPVRPMLSPVRPRVGADNSATRAHHARPERGRRDAVRPRLDAEDRLVVTDRARDGERSHPCRCMFAKRHREDRIDFSFHG
jgi:hypothetical protein